MFSNNKYRLKYKPQKLSHPSRYNIRKPYKQPLSVNQTLELQNKIKPILKLETYLYGSGDGMIVTDFVCDYIIEKATINGIIVYRQMSGILKDAFDAMSKLDLQIKEFIEKCRQYQQLVTLIFFCRKYHQTLRKVDKYVLTNVLLPYAQEFNFQAAYKTLRLDFMSHIESQFTVRPERWQECYLMDKVAPYQTLLNLH